MGAAGGERARDAALVGQDALLERALGLERALEDVAVGQSRVLVDQRPRVAERGERLGHVRKLRRPPSETLARLARLTMASATSSTADEDEQPGQLPAQRDAARHRQGGNEGRRTDASPRLLDGAGAN